MKLITLNKEEISSIDYRIDQEVGKVNSHNFLGIKNVYKTYSLKEKTLFFMPKKITIVNGKIYKKNKIRIILKSGVVLVLKSNQIDKVKASEIINQMNSIEEQSLSILY